MADSLVSRSRFRRGAVGWYVVKRDAMTVPVCGPFRRKGSAEGRVSDWSRLTVLYVSDEPGQTAAAVPVVEARQLSIYDVDGV
jgi:hypothetical protein